MMKDVLTDFQYIEEYLRRDLELCYRIIRHKLAGAIPYKFGDRDNETLALGRLIDQFAHFCDDDALVAELKDLIQYRNGVAHRGYCLSLGELRDRALLTRLSDRLAEVKERTDQCMDHMILRSATLVMLEGDLARSASAPIGSCARPSATSGDGTKHDSDSPQ